MAAAAADRSNGAPSSRPAPPRRTSDDTTANDGSPLALALDCLPALPALLLGLLLACSLALTPPRQVHDRPRGDLAFVAFAYADLAALFWCARRVERLTAAAAAAAAPTSSPGPVRDERRRRRLQVAVWVLSTALSCAFAYRVSLILPPALVLVVWAMASFVVLFGFYVLVLCEDQEYRLLEVAGDGEGGDLVDKKSGAGSGELV